MKRGSPNEPQAAPSKKPRRENVRDLSLPDGIGQAGRDRQKGEWPNADTLDYLCWPERELSIPPSAFHLLGLLGVPPSWLILIQYPLCLHSPIPTSLSSSTMPSATLSKNLCNLKYDHFRSRIKPTLAALARRGDGILHVKCQEIIYEYFGTDNPRVINIIYDHFVSNEVWKEIAVAYKLHLYIRVPRTRCDDKWWADVWEAYWGALFIERKLWNDDEEELTSFLRRLIYIQFKDAWQHLSTFPFPVCQTVLK
jgi:hypothetical protein